MSTIDYHLEELEIARNRADPAYCMPDLHPSEKIVVDIGCGVGQFFLATEFGDRIAIGVDIDPDAIRYGIQNYGNRICYILGDASRLAIPCKIADLVISRVSLPYTNIPRVVGEIGRVLKPGGRFWATLHDRSMTEARLRSAIENRGIKDTLRQLYVLANGHILSKFGLVIPFITGEYESWQDPDRFVRILEQRGFSARWEKLGRHVIVEATLR